MEFSEQEKTIRSFLDTFDRTQLIDRRNDPFVLVTKVSNRCFDVSSFLHICSESNEVYNESIPQDLLACAMLLTSKSVRLIPSFPPIKEIFGNAQAWKDDRNGIAIIIAVVANNTDAELIVQSLMSLLSSLPK